MPHVLSREKNSKCTSQNKISLKKMHLFHFLTKDNYVSLILYFHFLFSLIIDFRLSANVIL